MRTVLLTAVAVTMGLSSGVTLAQSTDSSGSQVDEIFVFAQKKGKAESLQEVPAAITAFNADQLDGIVFQKLDDLSYSIPNVQLEQVGTFPGVQNFSIRGQGINSSIPSVDPTVGIFVDGIYQSTTYGTVLDTWDLESVEILRGPQGLLFGRNVTGGAVTLRTARPDPSGELMIKAKASMTNEDRYGGAVAFEAPLVQDVFAAKIMLYYDKDDGYYENVNPAPGASGPVNTAITGGLPIPGYTASQFTQFDPVAQGSSSQRDAGELETKIVRPSFVWNISDTLRLDFIGEYGEADGDGAVWTVVGDVRNTLGPFTIQPVAAPPWMLNPPTFGSSYPAVGSVANGGIQPFTTTSDEYGFADVEWKSATLELNWDVWGGTLTNIFGWKDVEQASATDVDGTFLPAFTATGATDQDQVSNELRFTTTIGDNWDMTLGAYFLDTDIEYREGRYIQVVPPPPGGPLAVGTPLPNLRLIGMGGDMETETYGFFWNNEYTFAEDWTLLAGVRYSDEEKKTRIIDGPVPPFPAAFCPDPVTFVCSFDNLEGDWDNWTPKLGLRWQASDNTQVYAFYTKGYRAGGFNFRNAKPGPIPPLGYPAGPTEEEEQDSYEIGFKTDVFDNRLRMNLAYFNNDIEDMQRELNQPDSDVVVLQATVNAGDAKIKGVEFEFQAVPIDRLNIYGSVGYLNGKYKSINPLYQGINPATGAPYIGAELPRLARWSFSMGGSLDFYLDGSGTLRLQTEYGYRDPNFYDDANTQLFDAQHRLGGSINWISPDESWVVTLFGKNLRDEANYGNLTSIASLWTAGPMQKGREYGLQFQWRN